VAKYTKARNSTLLQDVNREKMRDEAKGGKKGSSFSKHSTFLAIFFPNQQRVCLSSCCCCVHKKTSPTHVRLEQPDAMYTYIIYSVSIKYSQMSHICHEDIHIICIKKPNPRKAYTEAGLICGSCRPGHWALIFPPRKLSE
jgi:hypothetical protein